MPGDRSVVMVSSSFWSRALGADPSVEGREITLNGIVHQIVGVVGARFEGVGATERTPDAWVPIAMYGALTRASNVAWWERMPDSRENWLSVVGRLSPGATFVATTSRLKALSATLDVPGRPETEGIMVSRQVLYRPSQAATLTSLATILAAVVLIVLLIATANVAVLLLARATTRERELGIRTALGASRGRTLRQLMAESLVLGLVGAGVGIVIAFLAARPASQLLPFDIRGPFRPDAPALTLALSSALVTAILAGFFPAWRTSRRDVVQAIGRGGSSRGGSPAQSALVVAQISLCLVLVAGAVLFSRSFRAASTQPLGFETEGRLVVGMDLRSQGYSAEQGKAFEERALSTIAGIPGVRAVATTRMIPFRGDWSTEYPVPRDYFPSALSDTLVIGLNAVSSRYFEVMGIPILRGRAFGLEDGSAGPSSVIVNEVLAASLWGEQDPIGRTVPVGPDTLTVVGVARNSTYYELGEAGVSQAYFATRQRYVPDLRIVVQTEDDAIALTKPVQTALRDLDSALAFTWVSSLEAVTEEVTARYQVTAVLVGLLAGLALLLASAGLYGVISFLVSQRAREIGIRMALGANRSRIARDVLGSGLRLVAIGLLAGTVGAIVLARFTESLLYGIEPGDPASLLGACTVLLTVALLATWTPARRATRVDPMEAFRSE